MKYRSILFVVCLLLVLQPVLAGDQASKASDQTITQTVEKLHQRYSEAVASGDAEKVSSLYTTDAVVMPDDEPAFMGRETIKQQLTGTFDKFSQKLSIKSEETEMAGDWIVDRGTVTVTMTPKSGGEAVTIEGKYMAILKKDADGSWKVARLIHNDNAPPPAVSKAE